MHKANFEIVDNICNYQVSVYYLKQYFYWTIKNIEHSETYNYRGLCGKYDSFGSDTDSHSLESRKRKIMSVESLTQEEHEIDGTTLSMIAEPATSEMFSLAEDLTFRDTNLRCHLTIIKWIGVVILATICAVPPLVILSHSDCSLPVSDNGVRPNLNKTECVYVKQFYLQESLYATVCNQNGYIFVDIRQFVNRSATIVGVDLSLLQWLTLKQLSPSIDTAVSEARTYWKKLNLYEQKP